VSVHDPEAFYDALAPYYHFIYADWEGSIERQSNGLATVLGEFGVPPGARILDAAAGIGTQTIGLAARGFDVTASDLSSAALRRLEREAERRRLAIRTTVADFRDLGAVCSDAFAAVIACDNAISHLLTDGEIEQAFVQCHHCLSPGGVLLVSIRDYAAIERKSPDIRPYGARSEGDRRYTVEQVWEWDGDQYDLTLRIHEDSPEGSTQTHSFRTRYYAVTIATLERLLRKAGFARVERRDEWFFQPLLVAVRDDRSPINE
jgi:SAM-dependent methyltransferase